MKRLIVVGSPRVSGRSAHLAEMLFEANIDEHPEDELFLVPLSEVEVGPCIACDGCREKSSVTYRDDDGKEVSVQRNRCVFDDDMQTLYDLFDDVDEVTVVSPVYFSGAPAQMKCLLDRLQPYYWANARAGEKRPATLHVVGEGGDPHGYDALVSEVRSALATAGFRLERILDWVGKIDEQGEIVAEAREVAFGDNAKKARPKLDLSAEKGQPAAGSAAQRQRQKQQPRQKRQAQQKQQKQQKNTARKGADKRHAPKKKGGNRG